MRLANAAGILSAVGLLLAATGCTSPVPPTVTRAPAGPLDPDPAIFVQATAHRERIIEALRDADVRVVEDRSHDYVLEVKVGSNRRILSGPPSRGSKTRPAPECPNVNNVAYVLRQREGRVVMVMKGRGPTGSCNHTIFDDMARELASYTSD